MQIFWGEEINVVCSNRLLALKSEVLGENKNHLLNMNEVEYVAYLVDRYRFEPLTFYWDAKTISAREEIRTRNTAYGQSFTAHTQIITYHIPFSGDRDLLHYKPNSSWINWSYDINIESNSISFSIADERNDAEQIKREAETVISNIQTQLQHLLRNISTYNESLESKACEIVQNRKAQLLTQSDLLANLGVPFKEANAVPQTFAIPVVKKKPLMKPSAPNEPFKPEPSLDLSIYNGILKHCYDVGVEMERHPSVYKGKNEETLRDHFIFVLAPHFESVTAETFNKVGKTDILIRHEKVNVFVAECKFWTGIKGFHKTIDQALGYLTWRDSKAAVICFVKQKELNPILQQIESETPNHPCFVKSTGKSTEGWFNYEFHLRDDPSRGVKLAVLCFHIPAK
jgi:hypothetical protein